MLNAARIRGMQMQRFCRCSLIGALNPVTAKRSHSTSRPLQNTNYFSNFGGSDGDIRLRMRAGTTTPSGAILPEPKRTPFGVLSVTTAVVVGLLIGATLSKLMANFLEEKELFVPSDDDDDDDDDD